MNMFEDFVTSQNQVPNFHYVMRKFWYDFEAMCSIYIFIYNFIVARLSCDVPVLL